MYPTFTARGDRIKETQKSVTINPGAAASITYALFYVKGVVKVERLYGVFTVVVDSTKVDKCYFDMGDDNDPAAQEYLSESPATGACDCSGAGVGDLVLRVDTASALSFLTVFPSGPGASVIEGKSTPIQLAVPPVLAAAEADKITIGFGLLPDADTDVTIEFFCHWRAISSSGAVLPGTGAALTNRKYIIL